MFFRLCETFFANFLMSSKCPPSFFSFLQKNGCSKTPKGPLLHFSALCDLPETKKFKKVEKMSDFFSIFSRRFSREKCPTLTVASFFSFFFVRLQFHSDWATFLTIETTKTTSIRPSPVSGN